MKIATLIALAVISTCPLSGAQTADEKDVLQFEHDACKAFLDADAAALERVLTPDFTLSLSNGDVSTRGRDQRAAQRESALRRV